MSQEKYKEIFDLSKFQGLKYEILDELHKERLPSQENQCEFNDLPVSEEYLKYQEAKKLKEELTKTIIDNITQPEEKKDLDNSNE